MCKQTEMKLVLTVAFVFSIYIIIAFHSSAYFSRMRPCHCNSIDINCNDNISPYNNSMTTTMDKMEEKHTVDILCRTFHGAFFELVRLMLSYSIFFPYNEATTNVIVILDAENELDHMVGAVLETAYKHMHMKVYFEEMPPPNTLTSNVRYEGYSRTQWSNFYSDIYSNAEFIAIVDSDAEFSYRPILSEQVIINWTHPVMHGILYHDGAWSCVKYMIGQESVAAFMFVFPFVVKRSHFKEMREHIVKTTNTASFEEAWYTMQIKFPEWGQFSVMGNYLYHFKHNEYVWNMALDFPRSTTLHPLPVIGKHLPMHTDVIQIVRKYHSQMCVQSANIASDCSDGHVNIFDPVFTTLTAFTDYWPTPGVSGEADYAMAKTHDIAAPFNSLELFMNARQRILPTTSLFWEHTKYDTASRTKNPVKKNI